MPVEAEKNLLGLDLQELSGLVENLGQPPYRGKQLFAAIYSQRMTAIDQITTLPLPLREQLKNAGGVKLVALLVIAGLVAPVCEELLFRGLLLRAFRRRFRVEVAIGASALLFALTHLLGDPSLGVVAILPALFVLGVISGCAAVWVGDLSVSIPLHMGFNLVTLAAYAMLVH